MHWRYRLRKQQLLDECEVPPEFVRPFADGLARREQRDHARTYWPGSSPTSRARPPSRSPTDTTNRGTASSTSSARRLGTTGRAIGAPDGVIVFDPSGFAKKGNASSGVQRQWLGRLGKVDNGQVGIFMAYASHHEQALIDVQLYLPKAWADDRARRKRCGIPKTVRCRTRHELALEMLKETGPFRIVAAEGLAAVSAGRRSWSWSRGVWRRGRTGAGSGRKSSWW